MHINLSNPAGNFPQQLSPLLSNINRSPYLSPLAEQAMRKCSYSN